MTNCAQFIPSRLAPICGFIRQVLHRTCPALFTTFDKRYPYLVQAFVQSPPSATLNLISSQGDWGRLLTLDEGKNDAASAYHIRWPECKVLTGIPLRDIGACFGSWKARKILAFEDLCVVRPDPLA